MATTGTYTYNPTVMQIIERACRMVRVLRYGQPISNEHLASAKLALNMMQKSWAAEGINLWSYKQVIFSLTASTQVTNGGTNYKCVLSHTSAAASEPGVGATWEMYWIEGGDGSDGAWATATAYNSINELSFDDEVLGLEYVFVRDTDNDLPFLDLISREAYDSISIKHTYGQPSCAHFDYSKSKKLWLYPMPDDTDNLIVAQVMYTIMDATGNSHTTDFPQHWQDAVVYGLADNLSDEYGVLSPADKSRLRSKAREYKDKARKLEVPTTTGNSNFIRGAF